MIQKHQASHYTSHSVISWNMLFIHAAKHLRNNAFYIYTILWSACVDTDEHAHKRIEYISNSQELSCLLKPHWRDVLYHHHQTGSFLSSYTQLGILPSTWLTSLLQLKDWHHWTIGWDIWTSWINPYKLSKVFTYNKPGCLSKKPYPISYYRIPAHIYDISRVFPLRFWPVAIIHQKSKFFGCSAVLQIISMGCISSDLRIFVLFENLILKRDGTVFWYVTITILSCLWVFIGTCIMMNSTLCCRHIVIMFPFICCYHSFWIFWWPLHMLSNQTARSCAFVIAPGNHHKSAYVQTD